MLRRPLASRRGSAYLLASLALLALVAASVGAMVAVVMAHAQRVSHQRDGVQALYLAEMGVEEMLTRRANGESLTSLSRTVQREDERIIPSPDASRAAPIAVSDQSRLVVGSYEVKAEPNGPSWVVRSRGLVATPGGRVVSREVQVACHRSHGRWIVEQWEQVP